MSLHPVLQDHGVEVHCVSLVGRLVVPSSQDFMPANPPRSFLNIMENMCGLIEKEISTCAHRNAPKPDLLQIFAQGQST